MSRDIFLRLVFSVFIISLIFALHRLITVSPLPTRPALASAQPLLFAHRGGSALAPENTLAAFRQGAELGADALELDVRLTADGELIVFHDESVERTTSGQGKVRELTLAQLRQLDAGYYFTLDGGATYPFRSQGVGISTLAEIYAEFPDLLINIDIKDSLPAAAERLAQVIEQAAATDRTLVGSFHNRNLRYFRQIAPNVATIAGPAEARTFFVLQSLGLWRFHRPLANTYQLPLTSGPFRLDSARFIASAHRLNQKVQYWTVDEPNTIRRLLAAGADGIITDRPDLAQPVFREFGY